MTIPSFLRASRSHRPEITWLAVAAGGGVIALSRVGMDGRPLVFAFAFMVVAALAFAWSLGNRRRVGCAHVIVPTVVAAVFTFVALISSGDAVGGFPACTGGVPDGSPFGLVAGAVLSVSLFAVMVPPRARERLVVADARTTVLGLWLMLAGANAAACARERRPITLICDGGAFESAGLTCVPNAYRSGGFDCTMPVPFRPLAELSGGMVLVAGVSLAAFSTARRVRRRAWLALVARGEAAGAALVDGGTAVVFDAANGAVEEANRRVVLADDRTKVRPMLRFGALIVAGALGVLLALGGMFMYFMAGEGARYEERYRNVPSMH